MAACTTSLTSARAQLRCGRPTARSLAPHRAAGIREAAPMRLRAVGSDIITGNVTSIESRDDFADALSEAGDSLVVLDISSSRCGPCKMVYPKFCMMSEEFEDASFLKIEGDTNSETVSMMKEWGVRAVPEFRFFRSGELIHSHTGADADKLRGHIEEHL